MAQIDSRIFEGSVPTQTTDATNATTNRQGWLKALESAGLREALANTRNFAGGAALKAQPIIEDGLLAGQPARHVAVSDAPAMSMRHVPELPAARAVSPITRPFSPMPTHVDTQPYQGASVAAEEMVTQGGADDEAHAGRTQTAIPSDSNPKARMWTRRKLVMLPVEAGGVNGIEVWVRDAEMSGARMQMLLADIRRSAALQGEELVKVSLNGRTVYSNGTKRSGQPKPKGD